MNVSLVRLTPRQWARVPDPRENSVELWREVPADELVAALAELERPLAEILVMHFSGGLTIAQIAARTDLPWGTVAARIVRGCRRLRRLLIQRRRASARSPALS